MRMVIAVVVAAAMLALALPAVAQVEEQQGQAFCAWYWDYTFNLAGGWEYWCWDPQKGWWYGVREDGKAWHMTLTS